MSGTLPLVDVLNAREKAILLWLVAIVVFAAIKSDGLGSSFLGVLRALAAPKLLLLFGAAAVYSSALVFLGKEAGLWHPSATKATVYWFFGTAVILVGNATQVSPDDPAFVRKLLRGSLKLTILVEFLVNLYVFPLVVECLLVPLLFLFIGMQVVVEHEPNIAQAGKVINRVLGTVGVGLMLYVAVRALGDWGDFWTRENACGSRAHARAGPVPLPGRLGVEVGTRQPPRALASFRLHGLERLNGAPVLRQSAPVPSGP